VSFELRHRKHIHDELTAIVRRQLRNRARALTTTPHHRWLLRLHLELIEHLEATIRPSSARSVWT